jgi:hypothetical protein
MKRRKQKGFAEWILVMIVVTLALNVHLTMHESNKAEQSRAHYDKLDVMRAMEPDDGAVDW